MVGGTCRTFSSRLFPSISYLRWLQVVNLSIFDPIQIFAICLTALFFGLSLLSTKAGCAQIFSFSSTIFVQLWFPSTSAVFRLVPQLFCLFTAQPISALRSDSRVYSGCYLSSLAQTIQHSHNNSKSAVFRGKPLPVHSDNVVLFLEQWFGRVYGMWILHVVFRGIELYHIPYVCIMSDVQKRIPASPQDQSRRFGLEWTNVTP